MQVLRRIKGIVVVFFSAAIVIAGFQNCAPRTMQFADQASLSPDSQTLKTCETPWGALLEEGQIVDAFAEEAVADGGSCLKEQRTCSGGALSGSFVHPTCEVVIPHDGNSCTTPWGTVLADGETVKAYQATSVPFNSTCTSENRTCNNGTLSGAFTAQSCQVQNAVNCSTPWGASVAHGQSVSAFQQASVPYGSSCVQQTRSCTNGTLSGAYTNATCTVAPRPAANNCSTPWGATVADGQSVTAFQKTSVPFGSSCVQQTRSCTNGTLSGSYTSSSCTIAPPAYCTTPWGSTITHGQSVTAFFRGSEAPGGQCLSQVRTCANGTLGGSYVNKTCFVAAVVDNSCEDGAPLPTWPRIQSPSAPANCAGSVVSLWNIYDSTNIAIESKDKNGTPADRVVEIDYATYREPDEIQIRAFMADGTNQKLFKQCRVSTAPSGESSYMPNGDFTRPATEALRDFRITIPKGTVKLRVETLSAASPYYLRMVGLCHFDVKKPNISPALKNPSKYKAAD